MEDPIKLADGRAMGKILVIEDDRNIQGLIEKIFQKDQLEIIKAGPGEKGGPEASFVSVLKGTLPASSEETVRAFVREEVNRNSGGALHEAVIGKVEKALIALVLEEERGNQVRAAKRLGINRNTLRKKMKDLQITTRVVAGLRAH